MEIHGDEGGQLDFSAYDTRVAELAWIVEASRIQWELLETVHRQDNITVLYSAQPETLELALDRVHLALADSRTLQAKLLVGAGSWLREAAGLTNDTLA